MKNQKIYEYLLLIAEERSITRAARRAFLSQPALTQQLRSFESELGFPVFLRTGKELIPTEKGRQILKTAASIQYIERETLQKIESLKKSTLQAVRIYIEQVLYNIFLREVWQALLRDYPDIRLELISGDSENALRLLRENRCDISIFYSRESVSSEFCSSVFIEDPYLLAEPIQGGGSRTLLLKRSFTGTPSLQQQAAGYFSLHRMPILYTDTLQEAASMAASGKGCSVLPRSLLLRFRGLHALPQPMKAFPVYGMICYRKSQELNPAYRKLRELLIRSFSPET